MPVLGMRGPYNLSAQRIDEVVKPCVPGVYALGYTRESGAFVVRYIGRSDKDVRAELHAQGLDETARFKWAEAGSSHDAFDTQCRLYHDFGGGRALENEDHPQRPAGTNWPCPVCDFYGR
jgi:hypothetical protein